MEDCAKISGDDRQWPAVADLSQGGNKLTQKEIAERMGIEEPTLAGLLDRLQEDGWIKRQESPNDRRCKIVHLQRRSKAVLDEIFDTAHGLRLGPEIQCAVASFHCSWLPWP